MKTEPWHDLIAPTTVNIILGKKGSGKSGLAYFLCEELGKHYDLLPIIVNLPREKQHLIPENFVIRSLDEIDNIENSIILIDEGTTMLPAGQRALEEMIKGYVALSRQRNQIIIFIFHAAADVGSRILRGVDAILLKEPSKRQIQHGSKDRWWHALLLEAKERFESLKERKDKRQYTYIDSEEPEFRGLVSNTLPSFWTEELSKAWSGVGVEEIDIFGEAGDDFFASYEEQFLATELRGMAREAGLDSSGSKRELIARLIRAKIIGGE